MGERDSFDLVNQRKEVLILTTKPQADIVSGAATEAFEIPALEIATPMPLPTYTPATPELKTDKPLALPTEKWSKEYTNYVFAGFGRFNTPVLGVFVNNGRNTKLDWGASYLQTNSFGGHRTGAGFSDYLMQAKGGLELGKHVVKGSVLFNHHGYQAYADSIAGQLTDESKREERWARGYTRIGLTASLVRESDEIKTLCYDLPVHVQVYTEKTGNSEFTVGTTPEIRHRLTERLGLHAENEFWFTALGRPETVSEGGAQLFLQCRPQLTYQTDRLYLAGGFNVATFGGAGESTFKLFPAVHLRYTLKPNALALTGSLTGQGDYLRRYAQIPNMPWLADTTVLMPQWENYNVQLGITGQAKAVDWRASFNYVDYQALNLFAPTYDNRLFTGNLSQLLVPATEMRVSIGLDRKTGGKFTYGGRLTWHRWSITSDSDTSTVQAFHLPSWTSELWLGYSPIPKLTLKGWVNLIGPRVLGGTPEAKPLESGLFADLNVRANYQFSNRLGVWVEFANLLNQSWQRWAYYIERPLDLRAGASFQF